MRRAVAACAIVAAAACVNSNEPTNFAFQYAVVVRGCDTTCATPGDSAVTSGARGDTVWVTHLIALLAAVDSVTPQVARLRADCAENVLFVVVGNTAGSLPDPETCPDSTFRMSFQLIGIDYPDAVTLNTRWIIDSSVTPGTYGVRGRVLVFPKLEPTILFTVQ